jgi:sugar lactone lactonase YvrE
VHIHYNTKWIQKGVTIVGGYGEGNALNQLNCPIGIYVDEDQTIYVTDCDNHRIMRWYKGAREASIVVGGNGGGEQANQFNNPGGISFDQQGNLYVVDFYNNRVQRFDIDKH